jgi:hypothetical protein
VSWGPWYGPLLSGAAQQQAGGGAQSLTGAIFARAGSFGAGVLSTLSTLAGAVFTKTPSFGAGTISVAADPNNLQVTIVGTTAQLTWSASGTPGVADYSIFRRSPQTGAAFDPEVDTPIATGITGTSYDDENLAAREYDWQVFGRVPA